MPDVARLMLMTPRGEGMPLPGKDVLLVRLGACSGVCAHICACCMRMCVYMARPLIYVICICICM